MTRLSIELVPRGLEKLETEARHLAAQFAQLDTVNIPDLKRMKLRSWDACSPLKSVFQSAIPHIRAWDFDLDGDAQPLRDAVSPFSEILVISGDPDPNNPVERPEDHCLKTIKRCAKCIPRNAYLQASIRIDPECRMSLNTCREKLMQGLWTVFSAIFSIDLLKAYRDLLPSEIDIFWGVSPVMSEKSKAYWVDVNRALFPRNFEYNLEYNQNLARTILDEVKANEDNIYFMPIRMDAAEYLAGIL